jgi:hypothetical protein
LVNFLILRLCNYDKSPDHVESAGKVTLKEQISDDRGANSDEENKDRTRRV